MTPTSLFIPLIAGYTWGDCEELRYALRSWEMYSNIDTVYICGYLPKWIKDAQHIPYMPNVRYSKPREIIDKAKLCPADEFIFSNDDIYLLKPLTELPDYFDGKLSTFNKGLSERYAQYVSETAKIYTGGLYYDVHTPMIMKKAHVIVVSILNRTDVLFKSAYGYLGADNPVPYRDLKINHHIRAEEIDKLIGDSPFLSTGERISNDMKQWLKHRFPNKSKYEI